MRRLSEQLVASKEVVLREKIALRGSFTIDSGTSWVLVFVMKSEAFSHSYSTSGLEPHAIMFNTEDPKPDNDEGYAPDKPVISSL